MNKLIVIEGTDCSGKKTQSELLQKKLTEAGISVAKLGFPMYDTPTGKIIAGPYLGKPEFGQSMFLEGATHVDAKVAGLYFAADRYYNLNRITQALETHHLILDRYVDSNIAHQGGKELNLKKRFAIYRWFAKLEYGLLKLPKPNIRVLLYMPREYAVILKQNRPEPADEHEKDEAYLKLSEQAYLEVAKLHHYKVILCVKDGKIRTIEDINDELYHYVINQLKRG